MGYFCHLDDTKIGFIKEVRNVESYSGYNMEKNMDKQSVRGFLTDLKSLVKGIVLIANVLPILSGFWLALYFTQGSFLDYWDR